MTHSDCINCGMSARDCADVTMLSDGNTLCCSECNHHALTELGRKMVQ